MASKKRVNSAIALQKEIVDTLFDHDAGKFVTEVSNPDTILDNDDVQDFLDETIEALEELKDKAQEVLV